MQAERGLTIFLMLFLLAACVPAPAPLLPTGTLPPLPSRTFTLQAPTPSAHIQPTPTGTQIQLPFDASVVNTPACQSAQVFLPAAQAQGLSQDAITGKLLDLWLAYYHAPQAPAFCRIDGYTIDRVAYDARTLYLPLEPKGDFMRLVQFSIKLIQLPTLWIAWAGDLDPQNWLHLTEYVAVFQAADVYSMQFANP